MIGEVVTGLLRVVASILTNRPTGATVETELNRQFSDQEWSITNYRDDDVKLSVQSISVRPKYHPERVSKGVTEVEGNHIFTHTGDDNRPNTLAEKLSASFRDEWVTKVQLRIEGGNAESIRPSGISLGHIMARKTIHFDEYVNERKYLPAIPPIRIKPTHKHQNDKLEMKARFDGEVGAYIERLTEAVEFLDTIQDQMETAAITYLLELHKSGDGKTWPDPERAAMVTKYIFEEPVPLEALDDRIQNIKTKLESPDRISEDDAAD